VTKYALFIPTREDATAVDFAEMFFEHIECRFGTPRSVVTDRDSRITSDFWKEICEIQMIKRRLSTAYHPQTDGQSEVLNRVIEDYLRAYSSEDQTVWARLLPLAQFAYNNSRNYTTGMSPNRLLFGFDCNIRMDIADNVIERRIPAAYDRVQKLYELRQKLREVTSILMTYDFNDFDDSYDFLNETVDDPLQLLFLLLTADEWRFSVQRVGDVLTRVGMIILCHTTCKCLLL